MFLSTGMANLSEIELFLLKQLSECGCEEIVLFHCISGYPTPTNKINLAINRGIDSEKFGVQVGLSDHTLGATAGMVAISLGASVIENILHLIDLMEGSTASSHYNPDEMEYFIKSCKDAYLSLGIIDLSEMKSRIQIRFFEDRFILLKI